jgi:hypothetical protein
LTILTGVAVLRKRSRFIVIDEENQRSALTGGTALILICSDRPRPKSAIPIDFILAGLLDGP